MQITLVSPNSSNLAAIVVISLQHVHSTLVGMIEQWPHKHLQVIVNQASTENLVYTYQDRSESLPSSSSLSSESPSLELLSSESSLGSKL